MKNLINSIKNKFNKAVVSAKTAIESTSGEGYVPYQTINYRIKSQHKVLKTENDFKEWQANVVASCLLLRPPLVEWAMFTFTRKEKITVFGEYQLYRQDRYQLRMMAEFLGVSISCLLYRLDRLGMLDHKSIMAYDPVMDYIWLGR